MKITFRKFWNRTEIKIKVYKINIYIIKINEDVDKNLKTSQNMKALNENQAIQSLAGLLLIFALMLITAYVEAL